MRRELSRVQSLGRRVSWLDRYRRIVTFVAAIVLTSLISTKFYDGGSSWSQFSSMLLGVVVGLITWVAVEVVVAWLTAFWETEAARIVYDRGLPRAVVHKPKRKTATT